jgi:hypothetical protein
MRGLYFLLRLAVAGSVLLMATFFLPESAPATPLFAMQSAERCDTCHVMPDSSDPRWVEENYKLWNRECRLSCNVCHVNPSGGMLRNDTGYYFGTKTLPMVREIPENVQSYMEKLKPNEHIRLGGDFRFMSLYEEDREKNPALFPMQADLYLDVDLHEYVAFMTQFGLERGGNAAVREAFGMVRDFPFNSYIKLGKFLPPFGHRLQDHTAFIRSETGFDHSQSGSYYSGVEIGAEPLVLFGRLAFFNEDVTPALNTESSRRGVSGVIGWRGLWLHLGASYMDIINYETSLNETVDRNVYGVFGAVRAKGVPYLERLTYLFEWDFRTDEHIDPGGHSTDEEADIVFNELNYRALDGVELKLRYETYDPEDDSSSETGLERYVVGVDLYPYPFTELSLQYRHNEEDVDETSNDEFLAIAHLWF